MCWVEKAVIAEPRLLTKRDINVSSTTLPPIPAVLDEVIALVSRGISSGHKVLSIALVVAIVGALGVIGYVIATPKIGHQFTEFYILGPEGKATLYPIELAVGEKGRATIGIINREHNEVSYRLEVAPIVLKPDEKWEDEVSFTPEVAGERRW